MGHTNLGGRWLTVGFLCERLHCTFHAFSSNLLTSCFSTALNSITWEICRNILYQLYRSALWRCAHSCRWFIKLLGTVKVNLSSKAMSQKGNCQELHLCVMTGLKESPAKEEARKSFLTRESNNSQNQQTGRHAADDTPRSSNTKNRACTQRQQRRSRKDGGERRGLNTQRHRLNKLGQSQRWEDKDETGSKTGIKR